MFAQPVDPVRDNCPNYFDLVKQPMDLGTIRQKILSGQYKSVTQWKNDVELVWSNSYLYNSKSSLLGLITKEMQDQFHKMTEALSDSSDQDWMNQLNIYHKDFNELMKESPKTAVAQNPKKKSHSNKNGHNNQAEPMEIRRHFQPFSKEELLKLTDDINNLSKRSHIVSIIDLIKKLEPNVSEEGDELSVDMNTLQPSTLHSLRLRVDQFSNQNA